MKDFLLKLSATIKKYFGYGIMLCLFLGGFTFFGYVAALIIGGETATLICDVIYNRFVPVLIYATNILITLGIVAMYLAGEKALTPESGSKKYKK